MPFTIRSLFNKASSGESQAGTATLPPDQSLVATRGFATAMNSPFGMDVPPASPFGTVVPRGPRTGNLGPGSSPFNPKGSADGAMLTVGDVLPRLPPELARMNSLPPDHPVSLAPEVMQAAMRNGRTIPVFEIYRVCPALFQSPVSPQDSRSIPLPPARPPKPAPQQSSSTPPAMTTTTPPPMPQAASPFGAAPPNPFGNSPADQFGASQMAAMQARAPASLPPRREEGMPPAFGAQSPFGQAPVNGHAAPAPSPFGSPVAGQMPAASPFGAAQASPAAAPAQNGGNAFGSPFPIQPPAQAPASNGNGGGSLLTFSPQHQTPPPQALAPAGQSPFGAAPAASPFGTPPPMPAASPPPMPAAQSPFGAAAPAAPPPFALTDPAPLPAAVQPMPFGNAPLSAPPSPFGGTSSAPQAPSPFGPAPTADAGGPPVKLSLANLLKGLSSTELGFEPAMVPSWITTEIPAHIIQGQLASGNASVELGLLIDGTTDVGFRNVISGGRRDLKIKLPANELFHNLPATGAAPQQPPPMPPPVQQIPAPQQPQPMPLSQPQPMQQPQQQPMQQPMQQAPAPQQQPPQSAPPLPAGNPFAPSPSGVLPPRSGPIQPKANANFNFGLPPTPPPAQAAPPMQPQAAVQQPTQPPAAVFAPPAQSPAPSAAKPVNSFDPFASSSASWGGQAAAAQAPAAAPAPDSGGFGSDQLFGAQPKQQQLPPAFAQYNAQQPSPLFPASQSPAPPPPPQPSAQPRSFFDAAPETSNVPAFPKPDMGFLTGTAQQPAPGGLFGGSVFDKTPSSAMPPLFTEAVQAPQPPLFAQPHQPPAQTPAPVFPSFPTPAFQAAQPPTHQPPPADHFTAPAQQHPAPASYSPPAPLTGTLPKPGAVSSLGISPVSTGDAEQLMLRALLGVNENLGVDRVIELIARLPGIASCVCICGDHSIAHGDGAAGAQDFQRQAGELSRNIQSLAPLIGIADAETYSINTNSRLMTFSFHPPITLAVLHHDTELAAGLRDKITLVGRELARLVRKTTER